MGKSKAGIGEKKKMNLHPDVQKYLDYSEEEKYELIARFSVLEEYFAECVINERQVDPKLYENILSLVEDGFLYGIKELNLLERRYPGMVDKKLQEKAHISALEIYLHNCINIISIGHPVFLNNCFATIFKLMKINKKYTFIDLHNDVGQINSSYISGLAKFAKEQK